MVSPLPPAQPSRSARTLLRMIHWYQRGMEGRPSPCRFTPGCSDYARESIERFGTARGGWLAVKRLCRCRPLGPSGYDPVPDHLHDHSIHHLPPTTRR